MKYVSKLKNFLKKLKLYTAGTILIVSTGASALVGCTKKTNVTKEPTNTVTEMPTPTDEVTITVTPTPTNTPVPTNTPTPTVAPILKKITVDDILKRDIIFSNYFGELEDVDTEMAKRKEYLESFGVLDDSRREIAITYYSLCYLTGDLVDHDKAQKYLSLCNEKNLSLMNDITYELMKYNIEHPENQIVISWLGIGDAFEEKERIVLNNVQYYTCKTIIEDNSYATKINPHPPYTCFITEDNGNQTREYIKLDDLNSVCKCTKLWIPNELITDLYSSNKNSMKYDTYDDITCYLKDIQPRLLDVDRIRIDVMGYSTIEYDEIRR